MEQLDGMSMDIEQMQREKLRAVFPDCFSDGKLDIDKLLSLCGEYIDNDFEKYRFEWPGKSECLKLAQKRSTGTLRPCPEESKDWDTTQNLYIEGDNLEVLKLLQTAYFRRVKMIYIDPPYNTGKDFVYKDDFSQPLDRYKEITRQTTKTNPETMGRFHTDWLNMIYPRLRLAVNLLRDDGVCFISIDDNEIDNLKKVCNEVFGEENYVATLVYDKNRKNDAKYFSVGHEYMLVYFKSAATINEMGIILRANKDGIDEVKAEFERLRKLHNDDWIKVNEGLKELYSSWDKDDERKPLARFTKVDEKGPYRDDGNISWPGGGGPKYPVIHPATGKPCKVPEAGWRFPTPERMQEEIDNGRVVFGADETTLPRIRRNLFESDKQVMRSVTFSYAQTATLEFIKIFDNIRVFENPKNIEDIKKLIEYITSKSDNDIILDFFSGSATTAHAVMQLNAEDGGNRQFICVQLPELCDEKSEAYKAGFKNICEIGKERIRRAAAKLNEELEVRSEQLKLDETTPNSNLDFGFKVFKLDSSNLNSWDSTPIPDDNLFTLYERMNAMIQNVKSERSDMDMVYEIMLKMGIPLTYPVKPVRLSEKCGVRSEELRNESSDEKITPNSTLQTPHSKTAYSVGEECLLLVCLAPQITPEDVEEMSEFLPVKIVLSKNSFANDSTMSNAFYILRDRDISLKLV